LINSNHKSSICAVIPFYNEKDFIYDVISQTLKFVDKVFAINDGSVDGSEKLISNIENLKLISLERNYGKGKALQVGFDEILKHNFDFIVTIDGDNQHDPKYIQDLVKGLTAFDIVIGNRLKNTKSMPFQRILSNRLTSFFLSIKTGQNIFDSQCGFRVYKKKVLKNIKTVYNGYEAESEILIYASRKGYKIGFVEIPTTYGAEKSKMNPFKAIFGFIKVLFK
jgi:glycosyltransferase involved in cell wall biosynthesis